MTLKRFARFNTTLIAAAVACTVMLSGCKNKTEEPKSDEAVIKIGHVAPISGAIAHLGKDNENGAKLAIEELNAKGIVIEGKKIKFQLIAEDDAADPKQGAAVAQKLVDAKVAGVIGHLNSGTTIPASKIYNDAGIPQISPSATSPKYTLQGFKGAVSRGRQRCSTWGHFGTLCSGYHQGQKYRRH